MALTPVKVALRALLDSVPGATPAETLPLSRCAGRVARADIVGAAHAASFRQFRHGWLRGSRRRSRAGK